jgi:hypothetical protein
VDDGTRLALPDAEHRLAVATEETMEIRFISSLTPEDENRFAPALLSAVAKILDQLPIAYTVRLETAAGKVLQHSHAAMDLQESAGLVGKDYLASS